MTKHALPDGFDDRMKRHAKVLTEISRYGGLTEEDCRDVLEVVASLHQMAAFPRKLTAQ